MAGAAWGGSGVDEETDGFVHALAFCVNVTIGLSAEQAGALTVDDVAQCAIRLNAIAVRQPVAAAV
ncbi:hypothetical protein [Streptomyces sp. SID8354]|uniref:hypothetical protein n=1 Tax=Streptomyces sp. SID8354 TaxID=2690339 RepID=UPI0003629AB6|nr:hypothetical protein [Streptomyces sp. SID8354]